MLQAWGGKRTVRDAGGAETGNNQEGPLDPEVGEGVSEEGPGQTQGLCVSPQGASRLQLAVDLGRFG